VAKYKKKRARELKHDKFRDSTMKLLDMAGDRLEGRGRTILYGIGGLVVLALIVGVFWKWSGRRADEARQALGRAITIASTPISSAPSVGAASGPSFTSAQERSQRAIEVFQQVAAKYGDPYRTEARYFIATNMLATPDRAKGIAELTELSKDRNADVAALAKFALAQAKEADSKYEEAAGLYRELAVANNPLITAETANLRLAIAYKQLGKKKEAADLLFGIVDAARKAKDQEGSPKAQSQAARDAADELQKLDSERYAQLPPEAPPNSPF